MHNKAPTVPLGRLAGGCGENYHVHSKVTITESQPDWLTVTCTDERKVRAFRAWARRSIAWEAAAENKERNFAAFGYEGVACGRVRWGARADGDIVQLSGDPAAKEFHRALDHATNVSRLDLAVTVRIEPTDDSVELRAYLQFLDARRHVKGRTMGSLVQSSDGGATFYMGKRTSDAMLRLYNKAVESDEEKYKDCHRYELELKGDAAILTATALAQTDNQGAFCQSGLYDWLHTRGVTPAFDVDQPRRLEMGLKRRSDADTKLDWLAHSVAPTVHWLREFGNGSRALAALGYTGGEADRILNAEATQEASTKEYAEWRGQE